MKGQLAGMEKHIVNDFHFHIPRDEMLKVLHIHDDPDDEDCRKASDMLEQALAIARPKYVYAIAGIDSKQDGAVIIEGRPFVSPLVRKNLDKVHRIVPYVATCGTEAENWSASYTDMMERFWADEIKKMLLVKCVEALRSEVKNKFFPALDMSSMNPGSLPEWPITEQTTLFGLIEEVEKDIGVRLTGSCLMIPSKSVSGFFFSSETHHENCMLCPRPNCPGRRAAYQKGDMDL